MGGGEEGEGRVRGRTSRDPRSDDANWSVAKLLGEYDEYGN